MKKLLALLLSVTLLFTLAGCGSSVEGDPNDVTIQFWHAMSGPNGEAVDYLVEKFNAENEYGITVEATYQGGYGDLHQKLVGALTANETPHIAQAYGNNIAIYMQSDAIVQLNAYIEDKDYGMDDFEDIIEGYRVENSSYEDGMFYSLPFNKSTEVLYYNKTFFMEHGLEVPTTWDELESVSREITAITGQPAFGYDSLSNLLITWTQQAGGQYTDSDGNAYFNSPEGLEALTFFVDGCNEGIFRMAGEDRYMSGPFNDQNAMMFIGSTSGSAYVGSDTFEWDSAQVPFGKEKKVIQQGSNMFMMESTPNEQLATFIFMKFLTDTENTAEWATRSGYLPVRESARESQVYVDFVATGANPTKVTGTSYDGSWYIFDPIFPDSYDYRMAVETAVEEAVLGLKTPEEALQDAYDSVG
jgi:multiple sugar transport system substrate-binding protein